MKTIRDRILRNWTGRALALCALLIALYLIFGRGASGASTSFRTAQVTRGDLLAEITASGTLEPEEVIDIGAQVAGQIKALGTDPSGRPVDFSSEIKAGQVLAQLDDAVYQSDLAQAEAQVKRAKAELLQFRSKLFQAERDWKRATRLGVGDALSQSAFDTYKAAYEAAQAGIAVGEAQITQSEAAVIRARRNLEFTTITSPVDGIIIDRRVNIGQTVAASLNAPSLFLLAKDLSKMQVWVSVNEADIGRIRIGQRATFTVDALSNRVFEGTVKKIRLNATMAQNVVTYIVEVSADNPEKVLLPYLTANVRFEVSRREDVLLVPNAALRYAPPRDEVELRQGDKSPLTTLPNQKTLWTLVNDELSPVQVSLGETDGSKTEVTGATVQEGMAIVVGATEKGRSNAAGVTNPFAPPPMRGRSRG